MDFLACYYLLGVPPGASMKELRRAYKRLALRYHPDRNAQDPASTAEFCQITVAYATLRQALIAGLRSRSIGVCQKCGRVAEVLKMLDGRSCCVDCGLSTRRRYLPLPQIVTITCLATILLQAAAIGCGAHFLGTGEHSSGVLGLILGLLSFATLAYYLWSADIIDAPPSKSWKGLSGAIDVSGLGRVLVALAFVLLLLLLVLLLCFSNVWFPSMETVPPALPANL